MTISSNLLDALSKDYIKIRIPHQRNLSTKTTNQETARVSDASWQCRAIAAQFMESNLMAIFEFTRQDGEVRKISERHYSLVDPAEISNDELDKYITQCLKTSGVNRLGRVLPPSKEGRGKSLLDSSLSSILAVLNLTQTKTASYGDQKGKISPDS